MQKPLFFVTAWAGPAFVRWAVREERGQIYNKNDLYRFYNSVQLEVEPDSETMADWTQSSDLDQTKIVSALARVKGYSTVPTELPFWLLTD